ncbi:hypothetical protein AVEN_124305-1, partial [Araneus ventricosus]
MESGLISKPKLVKKPPPATAPDPLQAPKTTSVLGHLLPSERFTIYQAQEQ